METGSIIMIIVFSLIFICGLTYFFMQVGKGGKWED